MLNTTRCLFPFIVERVLKNKSAKVEVLIPPAVPIDEPPINIRNKHIITVVLLKLLCENVINPAVLSVTDWKRLAISLFPKDILPIVPLFVNSSKSTSIIPPNIREAVAISVILE